MRMHDDKNDDVLNRANGVPSLLTLCDPLNERYAEGIVKHQLSRLKVNAMLVLVGLVLCPIPFNPYLYLHNSTYG
jgi:hypothetical protein